MGASSVTGVGHGSAVKAGQKGAKSTSIGAGFILGPHIVAAGTATLSSGTKAVHIPLLPGAASDYVVVGGNQTNANAWKAVVALGTDTTITFTGTGSDVIGYAVIKVGLA